MSTPPSSGPYAIGVDFGTESGRAVLVEAYLLDTDADLYGRRLKLDFVARLRGERRFDDVDALVAQMHEDVRRTRALLTA